MKDKNMKIKVYAHISAGQLIEEGEAAGLSAGAVDYFRHCGKVALELHVDPESGAVCGCEVLTNFTDAS